MRVTPFSYLEQQEVSGLPDIPDIVTTDLQTWEWAHSSTSYPGTGATWFDISGATVYDLSLVGSPTFNSTNPKSFTLTNSISEYMDYSSAIIDPDSNFSVNMWIKTPATLSDNSETRLLAQGNGNNTYSGRWFSLEFNLNGDGLVGRFDDRSNVRTISTGTVFSPNTWYMISWSVTRAGNNVDQTIYIDTTSSATGTGTMNTLTPVVTNTLVGILYFGTSYIVPFVGELAHVALYTDALTSGEVTTNYNATKDYFV